MKDSEKHHESEKSKKKSVQELSLNASKILLNQQKKIKQNKKNNSKKYLLKKTRTDMKQFYMKQKFFR